MRQDWYENEHLAHLLGAHYYSLRSCFSRKSLTRLGYIMLQSARLSCGRLRVQAPDQTNTQGLKITEEDVLHLL